MKYKNIAVIAAKNNKEAIHKKDSIVAKYGFKDITPDHRNIQNIDLVIAIGGDGLMLHLLHEYENKPLALYGINSGTVGFLMNSYHPDNLLESIKSAEESNLYPLRMEVTTQNGEKHSHIAINEVALIRQSSQAAKINIEVNGRKRIETLIADGALVSTAAGSTAYNLSVRGPIIPFGAKIIALTPISPFRPRNWRGALLPANSKIKFEVINGNSRPVSATADSSEVRDVKEVVIFEDTSISFKILFDPNHSLEERIIREQFV
ncbi:MAG: NAD kinase [Rickettsiales bacterium]|nr:NAD kinase [Rickettsiales bacterium]